MPTLEMLVAVADEGLHSWVRAAVPEVERRAALQSELEWAVVTATSDLEFARDFAARQPQSGQPAEAFLNRWLPVASDLEVLAGPRYRGLDPERPFVAIDAATRLLRPGDLPGVAAVVRAGFAAFEPGYLRSWSSTRAGSWPGTRADNRNVAGRLGDLRGNQVPSELRAATPPDLAFYDRYARTHAEQVTREPAHALHTRSESVEDLEELRTAGTLFIVWLDGQEVGLIAAEPRFQRGLRGAVVVELFLDPTVRGRGYGKHLSSLLARSLDLPDEQFLLGTIHVDNTASYKSAIAAGRRDVGGEVVVPLT